MRGNIKEYINSVLGGRLKEIKNSELCSMLMFQDDYAIADFMAACVIAQTSTQTPHISEVKITFTDVVPGRYCNDGGDYGFYTSYRPTKMPGVYLVSTWTTCEFDDCGTGYIGYKFVSENEYEELKKRSDRIREAGSQY